MFKLELPRTLLLQVTQPVLQFKLDRLAGVKKQSCWVLEVLLVFTSVLTHRGSFRVRLSSFLLVDNLGLDSFYLLKGDGLNLCRGITGFEMLSKCHGIFDRNL